MKRVGQPVASTAELVAARARAHARLGAHWMAQLWQAGETSVDQGLAITAAEVARLLRTPAERQAMREALLRDDDAARTLRREAQDADAALRDDAAWSRWLATFELSPPEADLLCLLLALAFDPGLRRVVAYLQDDARAVEPTAALASSLFEHATPLPFPVGALLRWRLAHPVDGASPWLASSAWQIDAAVPRSLLDGTWTDPALDGLVTLVTPQAVAGLPVLFDPPLARLRDLAAHGDVALVGPEGSGRRTLAAQAAAADDRPLLVIDTRALLARHGSDDEGLLAAARMAAAIGAWPYWCEGELVPAAAWPSLRRLVPRHLRAQRSLPEAAVAALEMPATTPAQRAALWALHSPDTRLPAPLAACALTPAEVALAAAAARHGPEAVRSTLRRALPMNGDLLALLPCPHGWDDLVLPAGLVAQLKEFESQVLLRQAVHDDWGFGRLAPLGKGIAALFGGPSGTGKTMAAQVLARSLGRDLYRIDLAGVVNKYIGETEKRLREVFDACERANAILFFDEADALFGHRTAVKDAHDRYANIEIDYLLQRVERFDGIAILATNRSHDIDAAFLRRMRFVVDFLKPGPAERLALWHKALPAAAPGRPGIVGAVAHDFLAEKLDLTGAQIKSVALAAAFLAHAEHAAIGMPHVLAATRREMAKQGATLRVAFPEAAA